MKRSRRTFIFTIIHISDSNKNNSSNNYNTGGLAKYTVSQKISPTF